MSKIVEYYCEFPSFARRPMWRIWHKLMIRFDKDIKANFMNYGYESLNEGERLVLHENDETSRYCIQLYDHVVNKAEIAGKDVLEVGSGRGGGASYITRYYKPQSYTAVDISEEVIAFCNRHYNIPGLTFIKGKAEKIPATPLSFDVVVNVESARCYSNIKTFFNEVNRVLRPAGHFMFADMIGSSDVEDMRSKLNECGFHIESETNITPNVVKALDRDSLRRETLIKSWIPKFLHRSFAQFAGTKGTERYQSFTNGKFEYWSFVLRK